MSLPLKWRDSLSRWAPVGCLGQAIELDLGKAQVRSRCLRARPMEVAGSAPRAFILVILERREALLWVLLKQTAGFRLWPLVALIGRADG
jgi:hypothetical protein